MAQETLKLTNTLMVLNKYGEEIVKKYKNKLEENKPGYSWNSIATGNLYNSVKSEVIVSGTRISIEITLEDYWKTLENGQPAGTIVSIGDLLKWIKAKPVIPTDRGFGIPTLKQLAFLIQRKIKREGTEPMNFMKDTLEDVLVKLKIDLEEAIEKDFTDIMYTTIKASLGS